MFWHSILQWSLPQFISISCYLCPQQSQCFACTDINISLLGRQWLQFFIIKHSDSRFLIALTPSTVKVHAWNFKTRYIKAYQNFLCYFFVGLEAFWKQIPRTSLKQKWFPYSTYKFASKVRNSDSLHEMLSSEKISNQGAWIVRKISSVMVERTYEILELSPI